jgi:phosphate transport system protein
MTRDVFHNELNRLVEEVMELGRDVQSCLDTTVQALDKQDAETAYGQIGIDSRYKEQGAKIDEECMILQARQAPVAGDLRLIYSVQAVTNHLVRAATLCEHICQAIVESADCERAPDLEDDLREMARATRSLFGEGLDIFENRDIDRARELDAADDKVDMFYSEGMNRVVNPSKEGSGSPEWRVRAALMVHYLERIADHGVDIGGHTVFLVTGERMENALRQYRNRSVDEYDD